MAGLVRAAVSNDARSISFERVREVVVRRPEHELDASIDDPIHNELHPRIMLNLAAGAEPGTKDAVVALFDFTVGRSLQAAFDSPDVPNRPARSVSERRLRSRPSCCH